MSSSLTFSHASFVLPEGRTVLDELSFTLGPGRHGVVGDNGSGKSTLLRLMAGELTPTAGTVEARGRLAYLPQLRIPAGATVGDVLGAGSTLAALARIEAGSVDPRDYDLVGDDWDLPERVERWLARVGLDGIAPSRSVSAVSGGEATLLRLAGPLLADPQILLLDEPTNDLDRPARERLESIVDGFGGVLARQARYATRRGWGGHSVNERSCKTGRNGRSTKEAWEAEADDARNIPGTRGARRGAERSERRRLPQERLVGGNTRSN